MSESVILPVKLDGKVYTRFGWYDIFVLQKRWQRPALWAGLFTLSALVCLGYQLAKGTGLALAIVLLVIGLGLPAVYLNSFRSLLRRQVKAGKMDQKPQYAYTLTFKEECLEALNGNQKKTYAWDQLVGAWKRPDCIYLYHAPGRAYLLPQGTGGLTLDQLWEMVTRHLPPEKLH